MRGRGILRNGLRRILDKITQYLGPLALDRARKLQERVLEDYNRLVERYGRAKEDLDSADERTQDALRLIEDAL